MGNNPLPTVPINLPMELVAKMEDLKKDRTPDCAQSVEQIVQRLCQDYVRVRELARSDSSQLDAINRSYQDSPDDWDDGQVWQTNPNRGRN